MNVLCVAKCIPMPDRVGADVRLFNILEILAKQHAVVFYALDGKEWARDISDSEALRYETQLSAIGIRVIKSRIKDELQNPGFDIVLFEYYYNAIELLQDVRFFCPRARIIIDSVDVVYARYFAKARLTNNSSDYKIARETRKNELTIYKEADMVLAISEPDRQVLLSEVPQMRIEIIPNIHPISNYMPYASRTQYSLLFVGNFQHDPNVDAVMYFVEQILPMLKVDYPDVVLHVIGQKPPKHLSQIENENIHIHGYVPDISVFLNSCQIAIAPLRFGAGLKGKVGEAMSHGLPVVSTTTGIEGFGLNPGEHVLVGDTPREFADQVIRLFDDEALCVSVGHAGWGFINENFSYHSLVGVVEKVFNEAYNMNAKKQSLRHSLPLLFIREYNRHIGWRIER